MVLDNLIRFSAWRLLFLVPVTHSVLATVVLGFLKHTNLLALLELL